jgi:hypothetical protein
MIERVEAVAGADGLTVGIAHDRDAACEEKLAGFQHGGELPREGRAFPPADIRQRLPARRRPAFRDACSRPSRLRSTRRTRLFSKPPGACFSSCPMLGWTMRKVGPAGAGSGGRAAGMMKPRARSSGNTPRERAGRVLRERRATPRDCRRESSARPDRPLAPMMAASAETPSSWSQPEPSGFQEKPEKRDPRRISVRMNSPAKSRLSGTICAVILRADQAASAGYIARKAERPTPRPSPSRPASRLIGEGGCDPPQADDEMAHAEREAEAEALCGGAGGEQQNEDSAAEDRTCDTSDRLEPECGDSARDGSQQRCCSLREGRRGALSGGKGQRIPSGLGECMPGI